MNATELQAWGHILDSSLATAIAVGGGYLLLRYFMRVETEWRTMLRDYTGRVANESLENQKLMLQKLDELLAGKG